MFILQPFASQTLFGVRFIQVFYGAVFIGVLWTATTRPGLRMLAFALVLVTILLPDLDFEEPSGLQAVNAILGIVFMVIALAAFVWRVMKDTEVTAETLSASVAVYLLMGLLWTVIYRLQFWMDAAAFEGLPESADAVSELFYFSFVTQTTLGYGDVAPVSYAARTAATLQAVAGQLYLVILIARLVGLHTAKHSRPS